MGVTFDPGADTAQIADEIKGDQPLMYRFEPKKGSGLVDELRPRDQSVDFVLFGPGKWPGTELHDSAARGTRQFSGTVDRAGFHAILVMRGAGGDTGMAAKYDLTITYRKGM